MEKIGSVYRLEPDIQKILVELKMAGYVTTARYSISNNDREPIEYNISKYIPEIISTGGWERESKDLFRKTLVGRIEREPGLVFSWNDKSLDCLLGGLLVSGS